MKIEELSKEELDVIDKFVEPMDVNIMKMSVGDVIRCIMSEKTLAEYVESLDYTVFDKFAFVKGFINKANAVFKSFEQYSTDIPIEYTVVSSNVKGLSTVESIICDCIKFFHLHSTDEAEKLPFGDWYLMKKEQCVSQCIERKYNKMMMDKQNREVRR